MTANAALPSGGKFLTAQEMHGIIGDTISGRYYNGSQYVDVTYTYLTIETIDSLQQNYISDTVVSGRTCCVYSAANISANLSPDYITFDLQPEFTIQDTNYIYSYIGHSMTTGISSSVYSPPRWEWVLGGRSTVFQDSNLLNPNENQFAHFHTSAGTWYTYAECNYTSNVSTSGYSIRASFFGNNLGSGSRTAKLAIGAAYVSESGSGASGTLPALTTSPAPSYTVIVSVDNAGVESGLNDVVNAVDGLQDALLNDGDYDYGDSDETIEDVPSAVDEEAIDDAMSAADTILDDIPSIIATGAFWMECAKSLVNDDSFIVVVPVCILLSFIVYLWWKK